MPLTDPERQRRVRIRRRMKVLTHYSGATPGCACCGETHYEFLSIDHVEGGGVRHRQTLPGPNIDRWLIRENFPDGYRVLCHNCNQALGMYGYCPHQGGGIDHLGLAVRNNLAR